MALPGILFCFIFVIGNFMLLNLFLAILLKSISNIGEDEEAAKEEAEEAAENGEAGEENGEKAEGENGEENGDKPDGDKAVDPRDIELRVMKKDEKKSNMNVSINRSDMPEVEAEK
jgi:hypothetical protein